MILDLLTFDPGFACENPSAYADEIMCRIEQGWDSGADLVLLPEFTWMGLEPFVEKQASDPNIYHALSRVFWETLLPSMQQRLARAGKAVIMGTVPCVDSDTHRVFNRAPILDSGILRYQDKLHLTPGEGEFSPGGILYLWEFQGFRVAVLICLDIEIPEISARLRGDGVDLILCPCATNNMMGVERVNRCASARSVELGCHVAVCHLTGNAHSELVDENMGRLAFYSPSQAAFKNAVREIETDIYASGFHQLRVNLDQHPLRLMRRLKAETNPAHIGKEFAGHFTIHQVESSFT